MPLTRRELLAACAGAAPALAGAPARGMTLAPGGRKSLGVVIHSYGNRVAADRARGAGDRIDDPRVFLEYCRSLGADGVQVGLGARDPADVAKVKAQVESSGMYLEGIVRLPRDRADLERFTAEVRTAQQAGVAVLRTVMLDGRRYETFATAAAFRRFAAESLGRLALAEPVAARHGVRLAVENHKDWRADELIAILQRIGSAHVGVCLDTGNSIALLEEPTAVVEALAPWAITTHFKDMAVAEYERGFLLAEVPLGAGFLDLGRIVRVLRAARPELHFNVEMITRDPLQVPCLTEAYWATFEGLSGRALARTLTMVRAHARGRPLPQVSDLAQEEKLKVEDENVRRCLGHARDHLGL
jgi:3-oxoisoapionate decarboxylase